MRLVWILLVSATAAAAAAPANPVVAVAARGAVTCTLDQRGDVFCWGGDDETFEQDKHRFEAPRWVGHADGADRLVLLAYSTPCALGKTTRCFGSRGVPWSDVTPPGLDRVKGLAAIAEADIYVCTLDARHAVRCLPRIAGEHSMESRYFEARPFDVPELAGADELAGHERGNSLCARKGDEVSCGRITSTGRMLSRKLDRLAGATRLRELDGARGLVTGIVDGVEVVCGRLATGTRCVEPTKPTIVIDTRTTGTQLALGGELCLLRAGGTVTCRARTGTEHVVPALADAASLAAGEKHACALRQGGSVACWGDNSLGQLGVVDPPLQPVWEVPGIDDATDLVIASSKACALRASGTVACWETQAFPGSLGAPHPLAKIHDAIGIGQLEGWDNDPQIMALRKGGATAVLVTMFDHGTLRYLEQTSTEPHLAEVVALGNSAYGTIATARDGTRRILTKLGNTAVHPKDKDLDDTPVLDGPKLVPRFWDKVIDLRTGPCAIAHADHHVTCFVDASHTGHWKLTRVLPGISDVVDLVAVRPSELAHDDGASDLCALRAGGEIACAEVTTTTTYRPHLEHGLVALLEGPCGKRADGSVACAWYSDTRWAAVMRAAERFTDVATLRFDADAAAACALHTNGHVACVRVAEPKTRKVTSSATPLAVMLP